MKNVMDHIKNTSELDEDEAHSDDGDASNNKPTKNASPDHYKKNLEDRGSELDDETIRVGRAQSEKIFSNSGPADLGRAQSEKKFSDSGSADLGRPTKKSSRSKESKRK